VRRDPLGAEGLITAPIFILPHSDERAIPKRNINERIGLESLTMSVMTGTCPKCGVTYCGWALVNPEFQKCDRCGCELEIFRDGFRVATTNSSGNTRDNRTASSK
jgi:hypothetical protein